MQKYTDTILKERLLEEDYPNNDTLLSEIIKKIRNFGNETQCIFEEWFNSAKIPDFDIQGITPKWLRTNHDMKNVGIIITYDWLLKEPEEAVCLLKKDIM